MSQLHRNGSGEDVGGPTPPSNGSHKSPPVPKWYAKSRQRYNFFILVFCTTLYMMYAMRTLNTSSYSTSLTTGWDSLLSLGEETHRMAKKIVDRSESSFPKESAQMGWDQVQHILDNLPLDGNLLIWGLGNDSPFWNRVTSGTVVFLEDATWDTNLIPSSDGTKVRWFDLVTQQHPELQAYAVNYTTRNTPQQREHFQKHPMIWNDALRMDSLPGVVWNTVWDVILVDAPLGYQDTGPGRFQSIFMTKLLVQRSFQLMGRPVEGVLAEAANTLPTSNRYSTLGVVHVFVDDYERPLEREFSQLVYDRLPIRVVSRPKYKSHVTPNQQAHFIFYANDHAMEIPKHEKPTIDGRAESTTNGPVIDEAKNNRALEIASKITNDYRRRDDYGNIVVKRFPTRQRNDLLRSPEIYEGMPHWQKASKIKQTAFNTLEYNTASEAWNVSLVDRPVKYLRKNERSKPILAVITSARSTPKDQNAEDALLYRVLIQSLIRTITEIERTHWSIHLYVAVDDTDEWWIQNWKKLYIPDWLLCSMVIFPDRGHHIPFNEIALTAYNEGADYFCRVNDDTEFVTEEWITLAVSALQNYDPPNVGVVGPKCGEGNTDIMTHDMVHRTHLEIFHGYYYPPSFGNWFLDDWITIVYSSNVLGPSFSRSQVLQDWLVRHWVFDTRYVPDYTDSQWLPVEYNRGRRLILNYLQTHFPDHQAIPSIIESGLQEPKLVSNHLRDEVRNVLPPDGNLLIFGFSEDVPYWHHASSGRVVFLEDPNVPAPPRQFSFYFHVYKIEYPQDRGYYKQMIQERRLFNASTRESVWCELQMPQLPEEVQETFWDVILIDSCSEFDMCGVYDRPGIFPMAYVAKNLVAKQLSDLANTNRVTHVFVDDFELETEREFVVHIFEKEPEKVVEIRSPDNTTSIEIAHFVLKPSDSMAERRSSTRC
jgi:Polysaccharide biosynthesis